MCNNIRKLWGKRILGCTLTIILTVMLGACPPDDPPPPPPPVGDTLIKGRIINDVPDRAMEGLEMAAISGGNKVASSKVNPQTGEYSIKLPKEGAYYLRLTAPGGTIEFTDTLDAKKGMVTKSPDIPLPDGALPATQPDIVPHLDVPATTVAAASTAVQPPDDPDMKGAAVKGTVYPHEAQVRVLEKGNVVASAKATDGKFSVPNVKPGLYNVEFSAPGFETVKAQNVAVSEEGVIMPLNEMLLYRSPLDGVDYDKGVIIATGMGKPNPQMPPAQASIMSCRAATVAAQRNLLDAILGLKLGKDKSVKDLDSDGTVMTMLQGFLRGVRVVKTDKRDDGSCEVTLQVPIRGGGGVTKYLREAIK